MHRIISFYFRHRKLCLSLMGFAIAAIVLNAHGIAFAQGADADPETSKLLNDVNILFNQVLRLSAAWLWPVLLMIGSLLDNDLIFGGEMGERLLSVWVQIRNLVNIVFVIVLVAIALYNVLGLGEEGGNIPLAFKTVMPKFVLALIGVNFSFLAVKVVLDFTNVMTGAVFALPSATVSTYNVEENMRQLLCDTQSREASLKAWACTKEGQLTDKAKNFFSRLDRSNIAMVYAMRFGKVPQLKFIRDGLKGLGQLGFNIIFNTVLYVVYALSFIVLFIVLLARVVVLWLVVVLSPLLALSIVVPNLKDLAGEGGELQQKFVKNAIAPISIGLVLSVGYIMLDGFSADKSIHGALLSSVAIDAVDPNALPTDITDLQQLLIAIGTVVIVWVGVFAATKGTVAEGFLGSIKTHAEGFGKWVAKLPLYAQVLPTRTKWGKVSPMQLWRTLQQAPTELERMKGGALFGPRPLGAEDIAKAQNAAASGNKTEFPKVIAENPRLLSDAKGVEAMKAWAKKHGEAKDDDEFKKKFGTSEVDIANSLVSHPEFKAAFEKAGHPEWKDNSSKFLEAIRKGPETRAADPKQLLKEGTAKAGEAPFLKLSQDQVDALKEISGKSERMLDALIQIRENQVDTKFTPDQLRAASRFFDTISSATTADDVQKALQEASRGGLTDVALRENIINASGIKDEKLKTQALEANKK